MSELPGSDFLFRLAEAAARETLPRFRAGGLVDNKLAGAFDPVTEADREAERAIRRLIEAEFPDDAILGEEDGLTGEGHRRWVIDPIDGTRAFISGVPVWGTLVGLTVEGRARVGLMDQPFTGERFWADGTTAYAEDRTGRRRLAVRPTRNLAEAVAFTTTPRLFTGPLLARFEAFEAATRLTRFGTDCYAFAMLASGHADLGRRGGAEALRHRRTDPDRRAGRRDRDDAGWRAGGEGGDVLASATPELHRAALAILAG